MSRVTSPSPSKCLTLIASVLILGGTLSCEDPQERYSEIQTSISGRVVNSVNGAALENVEIRTEPVSQAVLTDSYGDYRLSLNVEVGQTYLVKARKMGFETGEVSVDVEEGENTTGDIVLRPASAPELKVTPQELFFRSIDDEKELIIENVGTGELQWSIEAYPSWLTPNTRSGILSDQGASTLRMLLNRAELSSLPGVSSGSFRVSTESSSIEISVSVCRREDRRLCVDGDVYWEDSCGERGVLYESCSGGARCELIEGESSCVCVSQERRTCYQGDVYWENSCGEREEQLQPCVGGQVCVEPQDGEAECVCAAETSTTCAQGDVYWQDSCGERGARRFDCDGDRGERCVIGDEGAARCSCVPESRLVCHEGDVYWEDSCGARGERQDRCDTEIGEVCLEGSSAVCGCVPEDDVVCYQGDVYWEDSCGERGERRMRCDGVGQACVSGEPRCVCAPGYQGDGEVCVDVDECATNNGGCSSNATCTNTAGSRTCSCNSGYTGNGLTCTRVFCASASCAPCASSAVGCPNLDFVNIQGGSFMMGDQRSSPDTNEIPVHSVTVPSFQMMRSEITVAQYRRCVNASVCPVPSTYSEFCNWSTSPSNKESHPINCVSWGDLMEFAAWVGARLPTEAEWEYAARGRGQNMIYPWGDSLPTCTLFDYDFPACGSGTSAVCTHPSGNTSQGLCDMSGNVWEWVLDEWHVDYNGAPTNGSGWCSGSCPVNASDSNYNASDPTSRVRRGGCWHDSASNVRAAYRYNRAPSRRSGYGGGRLVR